MSGSRVLDKSGDEAARGETRSETRRFDAGSLDDPWILKIAPDKEIGERFSRRVDLRPDPASAEPHVLQRDLTQETTRRFDERFDRQPVRLVIVFRLLKRRRRAQPHL